MERSIFNNIRTRIFSLISASQHGFLAGRSCVTQLVKVLEQIGKGGQVDIIYLDMSKAFDKVSHEKLLKKLQHYGFGGSLLAWFRSYLRDRSQRVTVPGTTSSSLPVTSGIPQGSILGPMLFLLYVNLLPDTVHNSQLAAFADDTKIFKTIKSLLDTVALQKDISNLVTWSDHSALTLSHSRSKAQRITRKLRPVTSKYHMKESGLEFVSAEKDLGLYIMDDLIWSKHVEV